VNSAVNGNAVLEIRDLAKRYPGGVDALRGVGLVVEEGELLAVVGPSGSGKSTLLHIMGTLDRPSTGDVRVAGHDVATLSDRRLAALRARHIGFVFQQFFLVEGLSAVENVAQGLVYAGVPAAERRRRAAEQLERVGLGHRLTHRPAELSGGQQQRVAVARALVSRPSVMFADEPTGNLDSTTSAEILALMRDSVDTLGQTTVMVTHDANAAAIADRVLFLADGRIVRDIGACSAHTILETLEEVGGR
jgi:putative ABC transport system ATP-binding protein